METQAEAVVESVRLDGAAVVASETIAATAAGTEVVVGAVAQVADDLEAHAEASEERHVEILEGEAWLRSQIEVFTAGQTAVMAQLTGLQSQLSAFQAEILQRLPNLNALPDSTPPNQTPENLPVAEPEPAKGGPEESEKTTTESSKPEETPPSRRRRKQVL